MGFREWMRLNEEVKAIEFDIIICNIVYKVIRGPHLLEIRDGDNKPKDYILSINKYQELFTRLFKRLDEVDLKKPVSITWNNKNSTSNIISFDVKKNTIKIFGCIVNSSKNHAKLYPKYTNRIHVGIL